MLSGVSGSSLSIGARRGGNSTCNLLDTSSLSTVSRFSGKNPASRSILIVSPFRRRFHGSCASEEAGVVLSEASSMSFLRRGDGDRPRGLAASASMSSNAALIEAAALVRFGVLLAVLVWRGSNLIPLPSGLPPIVVLFAFTGGCLNICPALGATGSVEARAGCGGRIFSSFHLLS